MRRHVTASAVLCLLLGGCPGTDDPGDDDTTAADDDDTAGDDDDTADDDTTPSDDDTTAGDDDTASRADADGDGWTDLGGDCDDGDAAVHPGAPEICDSLDNDCDGDTDENGCWIETGAGGHFTCGIWEDHTVRCWGMAAGGQTAPPAGVFEEMFVGTDCSYVLDAAGALSMWGPNNYGQCDVTGTGYHHVSVSGQHSCALTTSGSIECWGTDTGGGTIPPPGSDFVQVAAGSGYSCALALDSEITCWGPDFMGATLPPPGPFAQFDIDNCFGCAIRGEIILDGVPDGEIACWGWDNHGQATPPPGTFSQVSLGSYHACALSVGSAIECWGSDDYGQASPPAGDWVALSAGHRHTCGLDAHGRMECWGDNGSGETSVPY